MHLRRPDLIDVEEQADEAVAWLPTYRGPDPSDPGPPPSPFRKDTDRRQLGVGHETFARAVAALQSWSAHLGSGFEVVPTDADVALDQTVIVVTRLWPFWVLAPCRVTNVTSATGRFGFTYVTLPGHPECGAETFCVVSDDHDRVFFEITSISRPADPLARMGGPISHAVQRRMTRRYLQAMVDAVARP